MGSPRRQLRAWLALPALVLALAACGGAAPPPAGPFPETAPYPFTVYEIRAGCASGRTIEYRVEKAGEPPKVERWVFSDAEPETVKITTTTFDGDGKPLGEPVVESAKWAELHEHARFPFQGTTISSEPLSLPAGTFDAMHYTVTKGDEVTSYWFARNLPGPPVMLVRTKGGQPVMTMTMQANLSKPR